MKKISYKVNIQKIWALGSIVAIMGSALFAFQNFVPHDSFKGHDTSDIYMNSALTDALKQAEKERRADVVKGDKAKAPVADTHQEADEPEVSRAPASVGESTETK